MKGFIRPVRYLLLTSFTLPETAGSGINAFHFARFINQQGDRAVLLTFNRNIRFKRKERISDQLIIRIPYFNKGIGLKLLSAPIVLSYYLLHIMRNNVIIIYGGKIFAYEIAIILAKIFRRRIVFQSLLTGVDDLQELIIKRKDISFWIYKKLFSMVNLYFAINQNFLQQYKEIFPYKTHYLVMPQGVNTSIFHPVNEQERKKLRKQLNLPEDKLLILSIGFLINRKGFDEIFRTLSVLDIDFLYCIVGDNEFPSTHFLNEKQKELEKLKSEGEIYLGNKLVFLPFTNRAEQYFQCSDIFLHNSIQEGMPNVLLEAMASGIPIIASYREGITSFVLDHDESALLYSDCKEVPELILKILNDANFAKKIADNAHAKIINMYSFEKVFSAIESRIFISEHVKEN